MSASIFTPKYIIFVSVLFAASSIASISLSHKGGNSQPQSATNSAGSAKNTSLADDRDAEIDLALGYAVNGNHLDAVKILQPLAEQGVVRAQLYLATAYYHGNGVSQDREKARQLFLRLQAANYEPHIVGTYLNLLGSPRS